MKVAYCAKCKPAMILGVGVGEKGKPSHRVGPDAHEGKVVDIPNDPMLPGESVTAYLVRLSEKHKAKFV